MKINCAHTELVELHKLVPNPRNPNKHSDEQIERLAKIIDFQGQRSPIVVSKNSGFIVKGHGRFAAITKLGWQKCAVDFQEYESPAQEYADMVADNAISEWASLDLNNVNTILPELGDMDLDFLGTKDLSFMNASAILDDEDGDESIKQSKYLLEVQFSGEMEMMTVYEDLVTKGYITRVKK